MKAWQADLAIVGAAAIWGLSFIFTSWGLESLSPALFLLCRFLVALSASAALFWKCLRGIPKRTARRGLALGFLMGTGYLLQNYSINFTEVPRAAFIAALTLPAIPVVSFVLFREKVKSYNLAGILLALVGAYLLIDPSFGGVRSGDVIALLSVPMWALYLIYMSRFTEGDDDPLLTKRLLILQFAGAVPLVLLTAFVFESGILPPVHPELSKAFAPNAHFWIGLAFCAFLASIGIVFIQTACQKYTSPVQAMLCFQFEPVTATVFAWPILGQKIGLLAGAGAAIIILGVVTSELGGIMAAKKEDAAAAPGTSGTSVDLGKSGTSVDLGKSEASVDLGKSEASGDS
ncbi:MAG: DMT family transporter [Deltaproteobacteria bacterium]|jgi:drug/metabolite transporter (DMT)-like permease|nr:DMT family transporter [Deltaproteobacteria bacterium]